MREYVELNRVYLTKIMQNAPEIPSGLLGLGRKTVKDSFEAVLVDHDYYFLPFCLYYIFNGTYKTARGKEIQMDEKFGRESFEFLHKKYSCGISSYFYAYVLRFGGDFESCLNILHELAEKEFSPALITLGDLKVYEGKITEGMSYYESAIAFGNPFARGRLWVVSKNKYTFFKKNMKRGLIILRTLKGFYNGYILQERGKNLVYLDFNFDGKI